jgi:hypothetical protein
MASNSPHLFSFNAAMKTSRCRSRSDGRITVNCDANRLYTSRLCSTRSPRWRIVGFVGLVIVVDTVVIVVRVWKGIWVWGNSLGVRFVFLFNYTLFKKEVEVGWAPRHANCKANGWISDRQKAV